MFHPPTAPAKSEAATPIPMPITPPTHDKVNASIQVLGLSSDGVMQDPKGPTDVGWYDLTRSFENFSSYPGWGGNAVFAGHVDYINYGAAVFWRLK